MKPKSVIEKEIVDLLLLLGFSKLETYSLDISFQLKTNSKKYVYTTATFGMYKEAFLYKMEISKDNIEQLESFSGLTPYEFRSKLVKLFKSELLTYKRNQQLDKILA